MRLCGTLLVFQSRWCKISEIKIWILYHAWRNSSVFRMLHAETALSTSHRSWIKLLLRDKFQCLKDASCGNCIANHRRWIKHFMFCNLSESLFSMRSHLLLIVNMILVYLSNWQWSSSMSCIHNFESPKMMRHSKGLATQLKSRIINIKAIMSPELLADIFTKPLASPAWFLYLRKELLWW